VAADPLFTIHRVPMLEDIAEIAERHQAVAAWEMAETHREWFAAHEALYRPRTAAQIRAGQCVSRKDYEAALAGRLRLREQLSPDASRRLREDLLAALGIGSARLLTEMLAEHNLDAWLCPAAVGPAPEGIHATGDPAMNLPWTQAGLPVVTIPAGTAAN